MLDLVEEIKGYDRKVVALMFDYSFFRENFANDADMFMLALANQVFDTANQKDWFVVYSNKMVSESSLKYFNIQSFPAFLFVKNGKVVEILQTADNKTLQEKIEVFLNEKANYS